MSLNLLQEVSYNIEINIKSLFLGLWLILIWNLAYSQFSGGDSGGFGGYRNNFGSFGGGGYGGNGGGGYRGGNRYAGYFKDLNINTLLWQITESTLKFKYIDHR